MSSNERELTPAERFRSEIEALEGEAAVCERSLAALETQMRLVEMRAMTAIKAGDDRSARDCLIEQSSCAEQADELRADLNVIRAMLEECYAFRDSKRDSAI